MLDVDMSVFVVFVFFVVKFVDMFVVLGGLMGFVFVFFSCVYVFSEYLNVDVVVESVVKVVLYVLVEERSFEYVFWDLVRLFLVRIVWGGFGGGGSGRFSVDNGFVVDVIEYIGDVGIGGSCEGVGEIGWDVVGEVIVVGCWIEDEFFCWWFVYMIRNEFVVNSIM